MSRTIKFAKAGGPEVLEFVEVQVPAPGPTEVRIKVKAIGINRAEAMWRVDDYVEPVKFPAGLGYEAAGIVDAVDKDVSGFAVKHPRWEPDAGMPPCRFCAGGPR